MEEIIRFVMLARSDRFTLTDLCEQFGISRKTAYKHLARYAADERERKESCRTLYLGNSAKRRST